MLRRIILKKIFLCGILFLCYPLYLINNKKPNTVFLEKNFFAMGTKCKVVIQTNNIFIGVTGIRSVVLKINKINNILTKFTILSDISKTNLMPHKFIKVSQITSIILALSLKLSKKTNYSFDLGMGNNIVYSDINIYTPPININPKIKNIDKHLLEIDKKNNLIKLKNNNKIIDLGGIAKGFTADLCANILIFYGLTNFIIDIGGDMIIKNKQNNTAWKISMDPKSYFKSKTNDIFYIQNAGISSSGVYQNKKINKLNTIRHHISNQKQDAYNKHYSLTTVIGKSTTITDSLSTAAYNISKKMLLTLQHQFPKYIFKFKLFTK